MLGFGSGTLQINEDEDEDEKEDDDDAPPAAQKQDQAFHRASGCFPTEGCWETLGDAP